MLLFLGLLQNFRNTKIKHSLSMCKLKACRIQTDSRNGVLSFHSKVFASTEIGDKVAVRFIF
jgi:hypothetical protein